MKPRSASLGIDRRFIATAKLREGYCRRHPEPVRAWPG